MVGYMTLPHYYELNFSLMQHHKYSMKDIEGWIPFERDIYVSMLIKHIEKENERMKQQN
jgi:hypothetical protein